MKTLTYTKKDFLWTKWQTKDIEKAAREIIARKKERYAEIKKIPKDKRTFENTIYAAETSECGVDDAAGFINILASVSTNARVRDAARKAEQKMAKAMIDIEYDEKMYEAVKEYAEKKPKEKLSHESKKLLDDTMRGYKRMGFELPKVKREKLKRMYKRLAKLSNDFEKNINEYKDHILVSRDELEGLPERYIKGLKKDKTGKYKVSLEYPDYVPFMSNAKNSEKRKELMDKNLQKGGVKNIKILNEALVLRGQTARILGYENHADFVLEERMAKSAKNVKKFQFDLIKNISFGANHDIVALSGAKEKETGRHDGLEYYDISYYSNILRKELYNIDSEKLREYFPLEHVKKEMFKMFGGLFGVKFEKQSGYLLWHKDVELYVVKEHGETVAYFIFDLFPRDGKYGHAAVSDIIEGRNSDFIGNEYIAPVTCLITNFMIPKKNNPSLLSYGELLTLLHEFGHLLHQCLTKARFSSQSGTSVKRDFVEVPSQILEYWGEDEKILPRFSKHYKNGKSLDKKYINNIKRSKLHMMAYFIARQLSLGIFDMELHTKKVKNPSRLFDDITLKYTGISLPKGNIFPAGFGHLFGYDAGYYSYLWSLVIASDMFQRFKKGGLLNRKIGLEYRKWILEKGSSMEEMEIIKKFLGRKPNNKAFLKEIGLK